MNYSNVLKWEVMGFFFIMTIGTMLHFCFEWGGRFTPLALLCAVNESVWEHLKLGFWPGLLFALIEFAFWGNKAGNFLIAKALSLYIMPIVIVVLFYSYTSILGTHVLAIDILIFAIAALLAQFISFQIIVSEMDYSALNKIALIMLAALALTFSLLTYFPPKLELFLDPRTHKAGIPN